MVHHGLWDWDLPAPPVLMTIRVDGRTIDAVAQVSKQGLAYVFDRVNGAPVWPIVEKPVPTDTDVPGEQPYPTQPFPSKPPAFINQSVTLDDANNLTRTGREVWRGKVPYANNASPMTYRTTSGRQFIVMATGAGADNALVAFALGQSGTD